MNNQDTTTVLAFGTFDHFHPGHEFFLKKAADLGDRLVVAVARDAHVRTLKDKEPKQPELVRRDVIRALSYVNEAELSDKELGNYSVISYFKPNLIAIGHDQNGLEKSLQSWMKETGTAIPLKRIEKYG